MRLLLGYGGGCRGFEVRKSVYGFSKREREREYVCVTERRVCEERFERVEKLGENG